MYFVIEQSLSFWRGQKVFPLQLNCSYEIQVGHPIMQGSQLFSHQLCKPKYVKEPYSKGALKNHNA